MLTGKKLFSFMIVIVVGFSMSACSLLDATTDTTVQIVNGVSQAISDISSSTTPSDSDDAVDSRVKKLKMFTKHNFMNLQQDVAQGRGEYLASLEALLEVPADQHEDFTRFMQTNYKTFFHTQGVLTNDALMQMAGFGSEEMKRALYLQVAQN